MHGRLRLLALLPFAAALALATSCSGGDGVRGPGAPGNLTATAGDGFAILNWAEAARAERYIVYIAREPGISKENYGELEGGGRYDYEGIQPPFQVDGLENGRTYFFVVTSVDKRNFEGPESGEVWANPSPWGAPSVLQTMPGEAIGLVAGVDFEGNLHAVWGRAEGAAQNIHSARFDSELGGWGAIATLDSADGIAGTPSLAVHPDGSAFVSWRQGTGPDDQIWGAEFDALNGWETAFLLTDPGSLPARNPASAYAGDDVFAVWTQNYLLGTAGTLTTGIFSRVAGDGAAFGPVEQLDVMTSSTDRPQIVAASNRGMAAWVQDSLVYVDEWDGIWSGAQAILTTSDEPIAVRLATNENADIVLLWTEQNLSVDLYAIRYDPGTSTWGDVEIVEQSALDVAEVSVAVCPGGEIVTVFTQVAGLHTRLMASRWNDGVEGWTPPAIIYESPEGDSESPSLVVESDCTARTVWIQDIVDLGGPGTTRNVYSSRHAADALPEEWGNALLVSDYGLNSSPVILVDSAGNVSALWEFYGATGEEIWFNRLGD
jgi:hypothetical protein